MVKEIPENGDGPFIQAMFTEKDMRNPLSLILTLLVLATETMFAGTRTPDKPIWQIGQKDGSPKGFALAPDRFRDFIENDFGYEDTYFLVGHSSTEKSFPYVLPGPVDIWGGTWPTAGWRTHCLTILFGLEGRPKAEADYLLNIHLADHATNFLPLVKVSLNDIDTKVQILKEGVDFSAQRKPNQMENVTDTLGITGNLSAASPYTIAIPLKGRDLHKGGNQLVISVLEGVYLFTPVPVMMIFCFTVGIGGITSYTIRISATQSYVPDERKGRFNGAFNMLSTAGALLGEVLAGVLTLLIPERVVLLAVMLLCALAAAVFIGGGRKHVAPIYNRSQ